MNIQIYVSKKNPDVLKAERFFKERRIPYQLVDLKKHKLGQKELALFAKAAGSAAKLVDRTGMKALERPVAHMSTESLILAELMNDPAAMICPIVRNGNAVTLGAAETVWAAWLENDRPYPHGMPKRMNRHPMAVFEPFARTNGIQSDTVRSPGK